ncbi:C-type lection lectoxin-Enh3-like [Cloeon dipterum]|uniref:C-type lection lectoxin-Enh3-like n=1 Tax=Cloeon dipterum TaxID=197152 RepID=UPI00321FFE20
MILLAVTSIEELNCLASFKAGTYWTSGSNEDENCDTHKKYAWCSTGNNVSSTLISSPDFWLNNTSSSLERCLALVNTADPKTQGLVHRKCDDALNYICQIPVECPQLFPKNMTWLSNWKQCCALGMETLNIDNVAEQLGLTNMTKVYKDNWKAIFNYWTSGIASKGSAERQWSWCESTGPTIFAPGLRWESGQPDNAGGSENCVHFRFVLNDTGTIMTDRNCSNRYIFACKV